MDIPRLGSQSRRYEFFLNPYLDARFTRCPKCDAKCKQRKLPLAIHVNDGGMVILNKTCRYCPGCELLIAHKNEIEDFLTAFFEQQAPHVVGNGYLVVGTFDRADWRRGQQRPMDNDEMRAALHDFKDVLSFTLTPRWVRPAVSEKQP